MSILLLHSDEISGTTILDNGTKVYWTEGHNPVTIVYSNGTIERVPPGRYHQEKHPVLSVPEIAAMQVTTSRKMTEAEEAEYDITISMLSPE